MTDEEQQEKAQRKWTGGRYPLQRFTQWVAWKASLREMCAHALYARAKTGIFVFMKDVSKATANYTILTSAGQHLPLQSHLSL